MKVDRKGLLRLPVVSLCQGPILCRKFTESPPKREGPSAEDAALLKGAFRALSADPRRPETQTAELTEDSETIGALAPFDGARGNAGFRICGLSLVGFRPC